jgi:hypothetical protein
MMGAAVFTYGMLTSFVLSGASRNRRLERPDPPVMTYLGHVLFGVSASTSVLLSGYAACGWISG